MRQARHLHRVLILSHLAACVNRAAFFRRSRSKNRASVHAHTSTRVLNWRSRHNVNAIYVAVNGVTLSLFRQVESLRRMIMNGYHRRPSARHGDIRHTPHARPYILPHTFAAQCIYIPTHGRSALPAVNDPDRI